MNTTERWYESTNAGSGQGLVISEATGANICVTYEQKDAKSIVDCHNACQGIEDPEITISNLIAALQCAVVKMEHDEMLLVGYTDKCRELNAAHEVLAKVTAPK